MTKVARVLRVLHLASFAGNIGDLANHAGARSMFRRHLDFELSFVDLEIREFYWKQRSFDDEFVRYANKFDLLIIGGGNYFELWVQGSATGTSIDITANRLAALAVPTVFYSLGVDIGQGYTNQTASRFRAFIADVMVRDNMFVCVRNDGSSVALREVLGEEEASRISVMPDGGFFAGDQLAESSAVEAGGRRIGINIAGDMLDLRFSGDVSPQIFLRELARACGVLLDAHEDLTLDFFPHIWRDVVLISELLPLIPERDLRRRISVAPLDPTNSGLPDFLRRYRRCDLVLGTRFHANVCPIGMLIPTIGLLNYPQVALLYEDLKLQDRVLDVRFRNFSEGLCELALRDMRNRAQIGERYRTAMDLVYSQARTTLVELNGWLCAHFD